MKDESDYGYGLGFTFAGPDLVQMTTTPQAALAPANSPGTSLAPV